MHKYPDYLMKQYPGYPTEAPQSSFKKDAIDTIAEAIGDCEPDNVIKMLSGKTTSMFGGYGGMFYGDISDGICDSENYVLDSAGNESNREGVALTEHGICFHFQGDGNSDHGINIIYLKVFSADDYQRLKQSVEEKVMRELMMRAFYTVHNLAPERQMAIIDQVISERPALQAVREARNLLAVASQTPSDSNNSSFLEKPSRKRP